MKKIFAISLIFALFIISFSYAEDIGLKDKLEMQLQSGSGFKEEMSISFGSDLDNLKQVYSADISKISKDKNNYIDIKDKENKYNFSVIEGSDGINLSFNGKNYILDNAEEYFAQNLFEHLNKNFSLPNSFKIIISSLFTKANIKADSSLAYKQQKDEALDTLNEGLKIFESDIELWLNSFAVKSSKIGDSDLVFEYELKPEDLKQELKILASKLIANKAFCNALSKFLTEEYTSVLLDFSNRDAIYYAIDNLALTQNIKLKRSFDSQSNPKELQLSLPLYDSLIGEYSFSYNINYSSDKNLEKITLTTSDSQSIIEYIKQSKDDNTIYKGSFIINSNNNNNYKNYAVDFELSKNQKIFVDENGKNNLENSFVLQLNDKSEQDNKNFQNIDNMIFSINTSYLSGVAKNTSTHRKIDISYHNKTKNEAVKINLTGKSTAPWQQEDKELESINLVDMLDKLSRESLIASFSDYVKQEQLSKLLNEILY